MRNDKLVWGGALLLGAAAAAIALPKFGNKARLAVRRATGVTHRSGVSNPGVRAKADPARGFPA